MSNDLLFLQTGGKNLKSRDFGDKLRFKRDYKSSGSKVLFMGTTSSRNLDLFRGFKDFVRLDRKTGFKSGIFKTFKNILHHS